MSSDHEGKVKTLTSNLLNVKDAILSELVRDNHSLQINSTATKKNKENVQENLNQETK